MVRGGATFALVTALVAIVTVPSANARGQTGEDLAPPPAAHVDRADELAAPDARPRVAVLIVAAEPEDAALADDLSELLVGAIAGRSDAWIVGKEEFQAQLGFDDRATLACIASTPCVGRVGVQLGVGELIAGTLVRRGDLWAFHLDRIAVSDGAVVARALREVRGDVGRLADALAASVPELYARRVRPATLIVECNVDARLRIDDRDVGPCGRSRRLHDLAPGAYRLVAERAPHRPWRRTITLREGADVYVEARLEPLVEERIHPLVWGGGATALATFAVGLGLGIASQDVLRLDLAARTNGAVTRAEAVEFYAAREREAIAADLLFVAAGLAATTAIVALFFPERVVRF